MQTTIIQIPGGFAVQNADQTFVGFASTLEIAQDIKTRADECARICADLKNQGHSLDW